MIDTSIAVVVASGWKPVYKDPFVVFDTKNIVGAKSFAPFVLAYSHEWKEEFEICEAGAGDRWKDNLKFYSVKRGDEILVSRDRRSNDAGGCNTDYKIEKYFNTQKIKEDFDKSCERQR